MNENKERWINIEEVAEYIGVSPVTVRYWLRSGKNLPGKRVGRQWRFRIKDIDEWIKSGKSNFDDWPIFSSFSMGKKALPEKGQGLFCDEDNVFVSCGWILIYYGYRYN